MKKFKQKMKILLRNKKFMIPLVIMLLLLTAGTVYAKTTSSKGFKDDILKALKDNDKYLDTMMKRWSDEDKFSVIPVKSGNKMHYVLVMQEWGQKSSAYPSHTYRTVAYEIFRINKKKYKAIEGSMKYLEDFGEIKAGYGKYGGDSKNLYVTNKSGYRESVIVFGDQYGQYDEKSHDGSSEEWFKDPRWPCINWNTRDDSGNKTYNVWCYDITSILDDLSALGHEDWYNEWIDCRERSGDEEGFAIGVAPVYTYRTYIKNGGDKPAVLKSDPVYNYEINYKAAGNLSKGKTTSGVNGKTTYYYPSKERVKDYDYIYDYSNTDDLIKEMSLQDTTEKKLKGNLLTNNVAYIAYKKNAMAPVVIKYYDKDSGDVIKSVDINSDDIMSFYKKKTEGYIAEVDYANAKTELKKEKVKGKDRYGFEGEDGKKWFVEEEEDIKDAPFSPIYYGVINNRNASKVKETFEVKKYATENDIAKKLFSAYSVKPHHLALSASAAYTTDTVTADKNEIKSNTAGGVFYIPVTSSYDSPSLNIKFIDKDTGEEVMSDVQPITIGKKLSYSCDRNISSAYKVTDKYNSCKKRILFAASDVSGFHKASYDTATNTSKYPDVKQVELNVSITGNSVKVKFVGTAKFTKTTNNLYIPVEKIKGAGNTNHTITIIKNDKNAGNTGDQSNNTYAAPDIRTYNYDDNFDVGTAVPTTETTVNGVNADTWYGNVDLDINTYETYIDITIKVNYTYVWKTTYLCGCGKYGCSTCTENHSASDVYTEVKRWNYGGKVDYMTYGGSSLYQLANLETENNAWAQTIQNYVNNIDIPYSVKVNPYHKESNSFYFAPSDISSCNGNNSSSENNSKTVTSKGYTTHVQVPFVQKNLYGSGGFGDGGYVGSSYARSLAIQSSKTIAQNLFDAETRGKVLVPRSDEVTINGVNYSLKQNVKTGVITFTHGGTSEVISEHETYYIPDESNERFKEEHNTYIPKERNNGKYSTSLKAEYKAINTSSESTKTYVIDGKGIDGRDETGDEVKSHIDTGSYMLYGTSRKYSSAEPIAVHSPTIAPVTLTNPEDATQHLNTAVLPQLILDNTYQFTFDWDKLFADLAGYNDGYDREALTAYKSSGYVEDKEVRFPFPVKYNGIYYPLKIRDIYTDDEGTSHEVIFTDWISLGADCEAFEFYIPTYAQTGVYDDSHGSDSRQDAKYSSIQFRTWANNSRQKFIELAGKPYVTGMTDAVTKNTIASLSNTALNVTRETYIATYSYPVQLSGVLYGFEIISTNDEYTFGDDGNTSDGLHSLVKEHKEIKVGSYDRKGNNSVRLTNGEAVVSNYANTLPLTTGKNTDYSLMGYTKLGTEFNFLVRSIDYLTPARDTYLQLIPHYRYIAADGTLYNENEIRLYYSDGDYKYIEAGGSRDTNEHYRNYSTLGDGRYVYSYSKNEYDTDPNSFYKNMDYVYKNGLALTSRITGRKVTDIKTLKNSLGTFNNILIPNEHMLYAGDESALADNLGRDGSVSYRYNGSSLNYGGLISTDYAAFEQSMQTWYGSYRIPDSLRVMLTKTGDLETLLKENPHINSEGYMINDEGNKKKVFESDGYLILSFDIILYKNGHPYLSYMNADLDMWARENGGNPDYSAYYGPYTVSDGSLVKAGTPVTVKAQSGDIAVIPLAAGKISDENGEAGMLWIGK